MEINWWKSMPRCCEPCFLIKDPKLLFTRMGCFPPMPHPVLGDDVPALCVWMRACADRWLVPAPGSVPGGDNGITGGTGLAQPLAAPCCCTGQSQLPTLWKYILRIILIITLTRLIFSVTQLHSSLAAVISSPTKRSCELPVPHDTHFIWVSFLGPPKLSWMLR